MPSRSGRLRSSVYAVSAPSRNARQRRSAASSPGGRQLGKVRGRQRGPDRGRRVGVVAGPPQRQLTRGRCGVGPAVRAPRLGERREDLVRLTRAVDHQARPHGIGRAGLDPVDADLAQTRRDGVVATPAGGRGLPRDVHGRGADPGGERGNDAARVPVQQGQGSLVRLVRGLERGGEPGAAHRTAALPQPRVDDEHDDEVSVTGGVAGGEQRRVVTATQVTAHPEHGGHRGAPLMTGGPAPGAAGRACPATRSGG